MSFLEAAASEVASSKFCSHAKSFLFIFVTKLCLPYKLLVDYLYDLVHCCANALKDNKGLKAAFGVSASPAKQTKDKFKGRVYIPESPLEDFPTCFSIPEDQHKSVPFVPRVSLQDLRSSDADVRNAAKCKIVSALHSKGFLALELPLQDTLSINSLYNEMSRFFQRPLSDKMLYPISFAMTYPATKRFKQVLENLLDII